MPKTDIKTLIAPNAIIFRSAAQGGIALEFVKNPLGEIWFFRNKPVYLMTEINGVLAAYTPPEEIKCLPDKLFRALNWDCARLLLMRRDSLMEKVNLWLGVALVGILAFIIFLILSPTNTP